MEKVMEDKLQVVRRWAQRGNLKQFLTDLQPRIAPLGYTAELNIDTIQCFRLTQKKSLMGLRKQYVREPVMAIRRRNGTLEFDAQDESFVDVLANIARPE